MKRLLRNLPRNNRGATLVEYALLLSVVSLCVKIGITSFSDTVQGEYSYIACEIEHPDTLTENPEIPSNGKGVSPYKATGGSVCTHNKKDNNFGTSAAPGKL